jgi:uncharacterized Zn-finger protein
LQVFDDDDLPKQICSTCVGILETCENFKEACVRSVDSIRKLIIANLKEEPIEEFVSAEPLEPIFKDENGKFKVEAEQILTKTVRRRKRIRTKKPIKHERLMCALCGKIFAHRDSITKHMKLEMKKKYAEPAETTNVKVVKISKNKSNPETGQNLKCTHEGCGRFFSYQSSLNKHIKMHEKGHVDLKCGTCGKNFTTIYILKAHMLRTHPETTAYSCEKCGLSFVTKSQLKSHITRGHNPLECHHCGATNYSRRAMLLL